MNLKRLSPILGSLRGRTILAVQTPWFSVDEFSDPNRCQPCGQLQSEGHDISDFWDPGGFASIVASPVGCVIDVEVVVLISGGWFSAQNFRRIGKMGLYMVKKKLDTVLSMTTNFPPG
jgi:hypothetical protein